MRNGLIIDSFAGGGGASEGIEIALGSPVDIAINHDIHAIRMHMTNHPNTLHLHTDVWDVDPVLTVRGRKVRLLWASPDCTHFSNAKGGKPVEKKIRGLAWVVLRWAAKVRPDIIMMENVIEFQTWGPLNRRHHPIKSKKGQTYKKFLRQLTDLGYVIETSELRACDYGAGTIRKRFCLIARCDGEPIVWPEPTHGDPNSDEVKAGAKKPYISAADIIDWTIPCNSIFDRDKPLVENTERRIARGLYKYVLDNPNPYIVQQGKQITANILLQMGYGDSEGKRQIDINKPLGTVTAGGNKFAVVSAFLERYLGDKVVHSSNLAQGKISTTECMVVSYGIHLRGTCTDGRSTENPIPTITAGGEHIAEVRAFLVKYYGKDIGQSINEPLGTIVTKDRFALVTVYGQDYIITDICFRMLTPRELFRAQGFRETYIIDHDYKGRKFTKKEQLAKVGNSVSPVIAEALVKANMAEECAEKGRDNMLQLN